MRFFDSVCIVYRNSIEPNLDKYNRPIKSNAPISSYPCMLTRKNSNSVIQGSPQPYITEFTKLYLPHNVNVREGDIFEVDGSRYKGGKPYKLRTHIEINVSLSEEI